MRFGAHGRGEGRGHTVVAAHLWVVKVNLQKLSSISSKSAIHRVLLSVFSCILAAIVHMQP